MDNVVDIKDLQAGVRILPLFAVDEAPDGEFGRISLELIRRDDAGADEGIGTLTNTVR